MSDIDMVAALLQRGISHTNRFRVTIPIPPGVFDPSVTSKNDKNDYTTSGGLTDASKWTDYVKAGTNFVQQGFRIVNAFFGGTNESARSLQAMCMVSALPGVNIDTTQLLQNGNRIKIANGITQAEVDFTFILSRDFQEKQLLDAWKGLIFDMSTGKTGYHEDYTVDICIEQLDSENNPIHKIFITDAYPMVFNSIELDKSASDQFQKYMLSFSFNKTYTETEYETRSAANDFLPIAIGNDILNGDWEAASGKAGTLWRKIKDGNFTGEALLAYRQLDQLVREMTGVKLADFERMSVGIQRDILGNDALTAAEKSSLLQLLKDVMAK